MGNKQNKIEKKEVFPEGVLLKDLKQIDLVENLLNEDKHLKKICHDNILNYILANDVESLKNIIQHNFVCGILNDDHYDGKYKIFLEINKKYREKFKDYKSLYFDIKLKKNNSTKSGEISKNNDLYRCTFKFSNNNISQCVLILTILQITINKKRDISTNLSSIEYLKKINDSKIVFQDYYGNTFSHILSLYDKIEISKFCVKNCDELKMLNHKHETPYITGININSKNHTSKYFRELLMAEYNKIQAHQN